MKTSEIMIETSDDQPATSAWAMSSSFLKGGKNGQSRGLWPWLSCQYVLPMYHMKIEAFVHVR